MSQTASNPPNSIKASRVASRLDRLIPTFVRAHWIALCVAAGVILLYALAGFFLVPHLAWTQAQDYVRNTLHRQLELGEVTFNPFTFEAVIRDLRLNEADGSPILGFDRLQVNAELSSLLRRAVVLKLFRLEGADVNLIVERDGSVNLAKLAPETPQEEPADENKPLPRIRIGELTIANGRVDIEDRTRAEPFTASLAPIHFKLTDFRTDLNYRNAYAFSAASQSGEQLEWSGDFTVQPLGSRGQFSVTGLRAQTVDDYLGEDLPLRLASGIAALRGEYQFALDPIALDIQLPSIELQDVALAERNAEAEPPVRLPQVNVSGVAFSYGQRSLTIDEVLLNGVQLDVVRESGSAINLTRLAGEKSAHEPASEPEPAAVAASSETPPAAEWLLKIGAVKLNDGTISFEDRTVAPAAKLALTPITLSVLNASSDAAAKAGVEAEIGIRNGAASGAGRGSAPGTLKVSGELQREPMAGQLSIDLADFDLPVLQPYIAQVAALTLHTGKLSVDGQLTLGAAPADKLKLKFAGNVSSSNFRTTDHLANEDFIKWGRLDVAGIEFEQSPDRLSIQKITARSPYARVIINQDQTLNVARVLNPHGDAEDAAPPQDERKEKTRAATPAKAQSSTMPMRIKSVQVIDGSAHFADYSIEPSFATGILGLEGTVTGLSSDPGSRATVKLKGAVDKYAPVDIEGAVNLLSAAMFTDIAMNFRNMELTTFNPYSGKFAGYNISKGKLSTELKYKVEDRKLDAQHHIVLDNLEFGDKTDSKDAAPIPVKLAVALLKDRDGVIDIDLPVSGSLDDPQFRLGPIIWKAFLNLLTKVVTAPFAALGALFGGGGEELAFVDFDAGSAELGASEREKLDKLAQALVERPQLRLNVPLTLVGDRDSEAFARKALEALVPATPVDLEDVAAKRQRLAAFEKAYTGLVKSAPPYPPETKTEEGVDLDARIAWIEKEMLDKLSPEQSALDELARQRAQAVQSALLANQELSPERVFITTDRQGVPADDGRVRMELKLE